MPIILAENSYHGTRQTRVTAWAHRYQRAFFRQVKESCERFVGALYQHRNELTSKESRRVLKRLRKGLKQARSGYDYVALRVYISEAVKALIAEEKDSYSYGLEATLKGLSPATYLVKGDENGRELTLHRDGKERSVKVMYDLVNTDLEGYDPSDRRLGVAHQSQGVTEIFVRFNNKTAQQVADAIDSGASMANVLKKTLEKMGDTSVHEMRHQFEESDEYRRGEMMYKGDVVIVDTSNTYVDYTFKGNWLKQVLSNSSDVKRMMWWLYSTQPSELNAQWAACRRNTTPGQSAKKALRSTRRGTAEATSVSQSLFYRFCTEYSAFFELPSPDNTEVIEDFCVDFRSVYGTGVGVEEFKRFALLWLALVFFPKHVRYSTQGDDYYQLLNDALFRHYNVADLVRQMNNIREAIAATSIRNYPESCNCVGAVVSAVAEVGDPASEVLASLKEQIKGDRMFLNLGDPKVAKDFRDICVNFKCDSAK